MLPRGTVPSSKSWVRNTGRKWCKDIEMFLYFGLSVFCAMSKVQCENFHLSLKKNSANIWVWCKREAVPGDAGPSAGPGRGEQARAAGAGPGPSRGSAGLSAETASGSLPQPRHPATNKQQTNTGRGQQSASEVNRRNLESLKCICVARQRHWN